MNYHNIYLPGFSHLVKDYHSLKDVINAQTPDDHDVGPGNKFEQFRPQVYVLKNSLCDVVGIGKCLRFHGIVHTMISQS